ncbi:MAG: YdeI/OmpD-associated family protein [Sphingomonadales bacterium]
MASDQLYLTDSAEWRGWLAGHHADRNLIWLVFKKKDSGEPTIAYEAAVEEALCYGWIDSIIKKLDDVSYARKFTPRKPGSKWSPSNKARIKRLIAAGRMMPAGQLRVDEAKASGKWDEGTDPGIPPGIPRELSEALAGNPLARKNFEALAPSYQRQYIGWVAAAKRPETRQARAAESIALLEEGRKLGMK